jgi:hypothetical protein
MAQRCPESAAPEAGFHQLAAELAGMRQELADLRSTVADLVAALAPVPARTGAPAGTIESTLIGSGRLTKDPGEEGPGISLFGGEPGTPPATAEGQEAGVGSGADATAGQARAIGSSPSALLARRNAERLAGEVQRRAALISDPEDDTELDLLIDRLHELALTKGPGA